MLSLMQYFLPILWTIVSTIVSLILYKSSSAFFESKRSREGETRRIRLVGSIVIAALVFLALWRATPAVKPTPLEAFRPRIEEVGERAENVRQRLNLLKACAAMTAVSQCARELDALDTAVADLDASRSRLAALRDE